MTPSTLLTKPSTDHSRRSIDLEDEACQFGRAAIHGPDAAESTATKALEDTKAEPRSDGKDAGENGIDWPTLIWIAGMHLAALAAPFYFTWSGLAICLFLCWVTGCLGVTLGYHRLLTHGSFVTSKPVRWFFAFVGGISGEGSAIVWVANHRKHHAFSDQEGDPHSPRDGGLWSHVLWLFPQHSKAEVDAHVKRWAPDLAKDSGVIFFHKTFLLWHFVIGGGLLATGWAIYGPETGVSWLLWGLAVRMVYVFHVTWFVNSATHIWGYRNYETTDDSRNLWWVGLLAFGEGWHNNHHAFQRMAAHGHKWWEFDMTYWVILAMERMGLAWNVVHTPRGVGQTVSSSGGKATAKSA